MENLKRKIFCALDFSEIEETIEFVKLIQDHIGGIKVGIEFFLKNGISGVQSLKKFGLPIFLDLKLNDIPNTVKKASLIILDLEPEYLTVHLNGGYEMVRSIVEIKKKTKIIGVSLLTSLNQKDLKSFGIQISTNEFVHKLAKIGKHAGVDGMVSSPLEVKFLKKKMPEDFIFITPGIRLSGDVDDQKRISTPSEALKNGSSILIIGRTITQAKDPVETIEKIIVNMSEEYGSKN